MAHQQDMWAPELHCPQVEISKVEALTLALGDTGSYGLRLAAVKRILEGPLRSSTWLVKSGG